MKLIKSKKRKTMKKRKHWKKENIGKNKT